MYHPSLFNLFIPIAGADNFLVFNTLRGSSALISARLAKNLSSRLANGNGKHSIYRHFAGNYDAQHLAATELSPELTACLLDLGILLRACDNEHQLIKQAQEEYWHQPVLKLTLAYTAACQLDCTYCFQSGRNLSLRHGTGLKKSVEEWTDSYLQEHPEINRVELGLFGGEPLTDLALASNYVNAIKHISGKHDKSFSISLTTNGVNLEPEIIKLWVDSGLKYVRITLDGPPDIHNLRRPFRSGAGSFDLILNNLKSMAKIGCFGIGISINIDEQNVERIEELLEILDQSGLREEVEILLEPVMPHQAKVAHPRACEKSNKLERQADASSNDTLLGRALGQVIERGFATPLCPGLCKPCNFVQSNSFIIDWSGQLFRCSFTMLEPQMSVGSTTCGITQRNEDLLSVRSSVNYCLENNCAYLPLCGGGCRYQAWCDSADFGAKSCPLELLDEALPLSITHFFGYRPKTTMALIDAGDSV